MCCAPCNIERHAIKIARNQTPRCTVSTFLSLWFLRPSLFPERHLLFHIVRVRKRRSADRATGATLASPLGLTNFSAKSLKKLPCLRSAIRQKAQSAVLDSSRRVGATAMFSHARLRCSSAKLSCRKQERQKTSTFVRLMERGRARPLSAGVQCRGNLRTQAASKPAAQRPPAEKLG